MGIDVGTYCSDKDVVLELHTSQCDSAILKLLTFDTDSAHTTVELAPEVCPVEVNLVGYGLPHRWWDGPGDCQ